MLVEVVCFFVVLYLFVKIWFDNYTKPWNNFQQVPLQRYTLLGHVPALSQMSDPEQYKNIHKWLDNSKTGSILMWMGSRPWLLTRDQKLFEKFLSSNKHITKANGYWILEDWIGNSLFLAKGDSWHKRRKLLTPSFHFNILQDFVKIMEKHSFELVNALKKPAGTGETFDAFKIMKMYTIGIISETAMGVESNVVKTVIDGDTKNATEKDRKFLDLIISTERMVETMLLKEKIPWYWYKPLFKLLPTGSQYYSDLKKIKSFAMNIIEKRIKELERAEGSENINPDKISNANHSNPTEDTSIYENKKFMNERKSTETTSGYHKKGTIFIDTLLSVYKNGDMTVEDILNETQTFMFAGYDTVATALSWSLYLLGRNKKQQDKAHEETVRVKALGLPIIESITQLNYIECVIKEVLRIHPSAGLIGRNLKEDTQFGTEHYPQGTNIVFCIHEIQRDARNYEEPMVFKPERFLHVEDSANIKENRHFTFVPFSAGPRNCIGQKFAMMEMKTTLFHLLSEYEVIATQKEEDLKETFGFIHGVENENGLEIKLRKRKITE